jgi:hypothetical protein
MDVHFFTWNLYGFNGIYIPLPSGKRLQKTNWKITMLLMGKSTISMGHFQSQTVCLPKGNIQPPNLQATKLVVLFRYHQPKLRFNQ